MNVHRHDTLDVQGVQGRVEFIFPEAVLGGIDFHEILEPLMYACMLSSQGLTDGSKFMILSGDQNVESVLLVVQDHRQLVIVNIIGMTNDAECLSYLGSLTLSQMEVTLALGHEILLSESSGVVNLLLADHFKVILDCFLLRVHD